MGIIITKYEDTANNNIKFDVSKFDYSYDDDSFPTDAQDDINNILLEIGDVFFVLRPDETTDSYGKVTGITNTEYRIYARIDDINKKDREIHDMGLAVKGNRKMYVKQYYPIVSGGVTTNYEVKEGDILKDRNDNQWRVIAIAAERYVESKMIFKVIVVQNIGLEGSS